jgi:prepilin-type N-terminal cleavage/methylation domain-containing protein
LCRICRTDSSQNSVVKRITWRDHYGCHLASSLDLQDCGSSRAGQSRGVRFEGMTHVHPTQSISRVSVCSLPRRGRDGAFTLVELMIVVVIIGVLAAIAIPAMQRVQQAAKNTRFVSDLRTFAQSFEQYCLQQGTWPPNVGAGVVPANMTTALQVSVWTKVNTLGGQWNWDRNLNGIAASVSTSGVTVSDAQMQSIDAKIDDGDLSSGIFQKVNGRFSYVLEQ